MENWLNIESTIINQEAKVDERHKISSQLAQSKAFHAVDAKPKGKDQGFFASIGQDKFLVKEFINSTRASLIIEWVTYHLYKILLESMVILPEISIKDIDTNIVLLSKKIEGFESLEDMRKRKANERGLKVKEFKLENNIALFEKIYAASFICGDDDMANLENIGWKGLEPVRVDFGRGFYLYFNTADDYWHKVSSIYRKYYQSKTVKQLDLKKLYYEFSEFKKITLNTLIEQINTSLSKLQEFITDKDLAKVIFKFRDVKEKKNINFEQQFTNFSKLSEFLIFTLKHNFSLIDELLEIIKSGINGKAYEPSIGSEAQALKQKMLRKTIFS